MKAQKTRMHIITWASIIISIIAIIGIGRNPVRLNIIEQQVERKLREMQESDIVEVYMEKEGIGTAHTGFFTTELDLKRCVGVQSGFVKNKRAIVPAFTVSITYNKDNGKIDILKLDLYYYRNDQKTEEDDSIVAFRYCGRYSEERFVLMIDGVAYSPHEPAISNLFNKIIERNEMMFQVETTYRAFFP